MAHLGMADNRASEPALGSVDISETVWAKQNLAMTRESTAPMTFTFEVSIDIP